VHTRLWLPSIRFHSFASFRELNHNLKKKRKQLENWPKRMVTKSKLVAMVAVFYSGIKTQHSEFDR